MIGIVILLFIPAFLCLLLLTYLNNKSNAKKAYFELSYQIYKDEKRWDIITQQIISNKKFQVFEGLKKFAVEAFLITKEKDKITVFPLNNNVNNKSMSLKQYEILLGKFPENKLYYIYTIDVYSIYYLFDKHENNILWIYRRSNSILNRAIRHKRHL